MFASPTMHAAVDPQLQMHNHHLGEQPVPHMGMRQHSGTWAPGLQGMLGADMGMGDSDRWSNSSNAPVAPTHLNVEDWFHFFGITGEMNAIGVDAS